MKYTKFFNNCFLISVPCEGQFVSLVAGQDKTIFEIQIADLLNATVSSARPVFFHISLNRRGIF